MLLPMTRRNFDFELFQQICVFHSCVTFRVPKFRFHVDPDNEWHVSSCYDLIGFYEYFPG